MARREVREPVEKRGDLERLQGERLKPEVTGKLGEELGGKDLQNIGRGGTGGGESGTPGGGRGHEREENTADSPFNKERNIRGRVSGDCNKSKINRYERKHEFITTNKQARTARRGWGGK